MKQATILFAAIAVAPLAQAQQLAVSISAPNPLVMSSTSAGGTGSWQTPGGSLDSFGYHAPRLAGTGSAFLTWSSQASSTIAGVYLHQQITTDPGATATVGRNEFVFEVSSNGRVDVTLELRSEVLATAGVAVPSITVDVGDNGTVDFTQATVVAALDLTIDAAPLRLRVTMENDVAIQGHSWSWLYATVKPRNDVTIQPAVIGCTGTSPDLFCEPSFVGTGVEFMRQPAFPLPAVVVLGLGVQPMLLPFSTPTAPCLLLPQPDAVLTLLGNTHTVSIPLAVRPVTFWGQGVAIDQAGNLLAMDGYRIIAQ